MLPSVVAYRTRYGVTDTVRPLGPRPDPTTNGEDRARYVVQTVIRNHEEERRLHEFGYSHGASPSAGQDGIGL